MATTYHRHMTQRVATDPYWQFNCSAYSAAMLANDSVVGGLVGITGRFIRSKSSEPVPDPGSPGLNIGQIRSVLTGLHIPTEDATGRPRVDVVAALRDQRRVGIQLDYGELGAYRAQPNGDFGHMIVLYARASNGDLWGSDPLAKAPKRYPEDIIFNAARVFARQTGVMDGLRWMFTRPIPLVNDI